VKADDRRSDPHLLVPQASARDLDERHGDDRP
jgi:hypothetical protein